MSKATLEELEELCIRIKGATSSPGMYSVAAQAFVAGATAGVNGESIEDITRHINRICGQ